MGIFKKKEPKTHRILITDNLWCTSGKSLIGLVELYFKKYGFEYNMVDHDGDYSKQFYYYEIEIPYGDKKYVEVLLHKVFRYENNPMTLNQYERWMKTERLRQKILNI